MKISKSFKNGYYIHNDIKYDISRNLQSAIDGTTLYDQDIQINTNFLNKNCNISISSERTDEAVKRFILENKSHTAVLNFASAHTYGGGFLDGSSAQEEHLCRVSFLYPCLKSKPKYYNDNIKSETYLYTNDIIYSSDVLFFRNSDYSFGNNNFKASVITSPAPNLMHIAEKDIDRELYLQTFHKRIGKILKIAQLNNHKNLILGAFGCGAFCNDAYVVAEIFKEEIEANSYFDNICFAIYNNGSDQYNLNAFKEVFNY